MPNTIPVDQIGVKLIGRTVSQTSVAGEYLEPDHTTASTITWLKPVDKKRLLLRIDSVLSNMAGRAPGRVALQSVKRAVSELPDAEPVAPVEPTEEAPVIHLLDRNLVSIGGFLNEDRSGGHVERVPRRHEGDYRLLVRGSDWTPGFALCGSDSDLWNNLGEHLGTAPGPNLWGYGIAGLISGDGRGTGWEIEQARKEGLLIDCKPGDVFVIEDPAADGGKVAYRLGFAKSWGRGRVDRHNIEFERTEVPE